MSDSVHSGFLRRLLWALRLRGPAGGDPTAQMLHLLTLILLGLLATHVGIAEHNNPDKLVISLIAIPALLTPVATLVLLRRGAVRASGIVYLTGMWVYFTAVISLNGGIHHIALAVYISLSVSAAWLFGYRAALLSSAISFAALLVMATLETYVVGPSHILPGTPFGLWFFIMESTLMGVVPVTLVLTSLRRALAQSQLAEAELQLHRQHLEELVQLRTAELVVARDQAQAANRAKSAFLATMSHELRTPLNAILGFSNLLRERADSPDQRRDLDIINRSGEHLLELINDILDIAKIEARAVVLEIAPCDLVVLVSGVAEMMRLRAEEKGLALLVEAPPCPACVRADAARLRQVLINLLGNAIKYTERGSVALRFDLRPGETPDRHVLSFQVEDTGIGIAAADQPSIFDAFVQAGKNRAQKGTGLGLAITQQLIRLMGGTIHVDSASGQGSIFRVEIPVASAQDSEVTPQPSGTERILGLAAGQPECRVLVVDDELENSLLLERLLQNAGFHVQLAGDGEQAVALFRAWRPHFIWMDLRMPVMSGIEATGCIRDLEGGRDVKIAAATASGFESDRIRVLASGFDDYVRKPYQPREIFDCMARHLGVRYRTGDAPAPQPDMQFRREQLALLPYAVRAELRAALIALDVDRVSAAVESVAGTDPALGMALARCANRYAYTAILNALEDGISESSGAVTVVS